MVKKRTESEKSDEMETKSTPADTGITDSVPAETASVSDGPNEESSSEDLLDDVRRSLIEEESDQDKKAPKWWRRFGRKAKAPQPEPTSPEVEIDLPSSLPHDEADRVDEPEQTAEPEEYVEQIDDLIDLLQEGNAKSAPETETVVPEEEVDFKTLKEQAFRRQTSEKDVPSDSDVRSIALEGGEEVFVEVEAQAVDPLDERLKALENVLKPYRSYIYMTVAFLGVVMAVIALLFIFNVYRQSRPQPVKEAPDLPYPVAVSLPGGWSFDLGRGTLQGGRWEPAGAEWLEGTEVCRWVSLPWSRQLEAVLRTLNPKDPIELVMSNNDKLEYAVYSVYEMTLQEIQALDTNTPCLLLILTGTDSDKRWVLTALP